MKRLLVFGVALIFLAGSWGAAFAAEDKKDGIPKSTKDKWIEQKKDKIDKDAADKKAKVVAPGMRAVDQAGADRKIQEIDDQAKQQKKQVDEDANKLGDGKPIYKPKDKPIKDPKPV